MSKIDLADVARELGMKPSELIDVEDTDAGRIIRCTDGTTLIDVPADAPDADEKTGLMFLAAPTPSYTGDFPIYAQPVEDDVVDPDGNAVVVDEYPADGSVKDVLAWVAGEQDRAEYALAAEQAAAKPRATLIAELEQILAQYPMVEHTGIMVNGAVASEMGGDGHVRAYDADGNLVASTDPADAADGVEIVAGS